MSSSQPSRTGLKHHRNSSFAPYGEVGINKWRAVLGWQPNLIWYNFPEVWPFPYSIHTLLRKGYLWGPYLGQVHMQYRINHRGCCVRDIRLWCCFSNSSEINRVVIVCLRRWWEKAAIETWQPAKTETEGKREGWGQAWARGNEKRRKESRNGKIQVYFRHQSASVSSVSLVGQGQHRRNIRVRRKSTKTSPQDKKKSISSCNFDKDKN